MLDYIVQYIIFSVFTHSFLNGLGGETVPSEGFNLQSLLSPVPLIVGIVAEAVMRVAFHECHDLPYPCCAELRMAGKLHADGSHGFGSGAKIVDIGRQQCRVKLEYRLHGRI